MDEYRQRFGPEVRGLSLTLVSSVALARRGALYTGQEARTQTRKTSRLHLVARHVAAAHIARYQDVKSSVTLPDP